MLAIVPLSLLLLALPIYAIDPIKSLAPNPIRRHDVAKNASELDTRGDTYYL